MKRKGIWIDSNLTGRGLSPLDKLLYSQIVYYSKDAGFCIKSNPELAIELEVSDSSVKRSLEILEEKGLLNRDTDRKIGNVRKLIPSVQNDPTPTVKMTLPSVQNDPTPTVKMTLPSVQNDPTYIGRITKEQLNKQSINNSNNGFQKNENLATDKKIEIVDFSQGGGLKEKEKKAPQAGGGGRETEFPFEVIWGMYGKKGSAKVAKQRYEKLNEKIREGIFEHVPNYVLSTPEIQFRKNFEVYLNKESYNDQIIKQNANSKNSTNRGFRGETGDEYLKRVGGELDEIFKLQFGGSSNEPAYATTNEPDEYTSFTEFRDLPRSY